MSEGSGIFTRATAATRIRRKLILLHTVFSLTLGVILILALSLPVNALEEAGRERDALLALELALAKPTAVDALYVQGVTMRRASASELGLPPDLAKSLRSTPGSARYASGITGGAGAAVFDARDGSFVLARAVSEKASRAVGSIYIMMTVSLFAVYALIALTLEVFVLPRQVYEPIERLRAADEAVQRGDRDDELIPDDEIRSDEMGEIMRSRNASIVKLRDQETRLGEALDEIERVATELKRKNHMLETAKRNIADQDRLASLGMMSAGIAHELNTPLSVLKGCTEELRASNAPPEAKRVELMLRVLSRLERLSDSLTDFARARPPATDTVELGPLLDEAWTLVSLDRNARNALVRNEIPPGTAVTGDGDRLVQVFVNLLRNAVDASEDVSALVVDITAQTQRRDEARWVSITIADNGPGIEPAMLPRLFEPFATTRLDARGSGLGLAVAEGIVKEHDGVILARNRVSPLSGAEFEVVLPADTPVRAAERTDAARGYHDSEKTGTTNTPGPLRGAP